MTIGTHLHIITHGHNETQKKKINKNHSVYTLIYVLLIIIFIKINADIMNILPSIQKSCDFQLKIDPLEINYQNVSVCVCVCAHSTQSFFLYIYIVHKQPAKYILRSIFSKGSKQ